ncbi:MAG TPA: hypothetical protein PLB02_06765 [Thermoanaerobaculia bacterium]|nr:hypothetical protein [Thermoanaerobaculia bacterium]HQR67078.1 hypothetical protein [Thermoanaerobaculia bacterium]
MPFRRSLGIVLVAIGGLLLAPAASAQYASYATQKGMDETFRIDVGGFFQKFDTSIYLQSSSGASTSISLENLFGQDVHKSSFRIDGYVRFGRHASLVFGYLGWTRSGSATLSQDVQWGDYLIHSGSTADSKLKVMVPQLYYAYSAVNNGTAEVGGMVGISTYVNKADLNASGSITGPGGTTSATFSSDQWHLTAPVPATGMYLRYALYPMFFLDADVKWLPNITISGYTGGMLEYKAGLDYYLTKNFGVGIVYQYTHVHVYHTETNTVGFDFRYSGPYAYLSLAF